VEALLAPGMVNPNDIPMSDPTSRLGLTPEALNNACIGRTHCRQDFEGTPLISLHVHNLIDDTHATSSDLSDDAVRTILSDSVVVYGHERSCCD
jgi:hypothetical protein